MKSQTAVFHSGFPKFRPVLFASCLAVCCCSAAPAQNAGDKAAGRGGQARGGEESEEKTKEDAKAKKIFSGPQAGEKLGSFPVWMIPDSDAESEKVDLREIASKTPVTIVVMHAKERPAFMVWRGMHAYGQKLPKDKMQVYCVMLSEDQSQEDNWLRGIKKRMFPKGGNFAIADGGMEGPGAVGLNRLATMTILVVKDGKVVSNHALTQITASVDAPPILKSMAAVAGEKKVPKLEELLPKPKNMQRGQARQRAVRP